MAQKCVHKGCEKTFTDPKEDCFYHPEPPIFHEGQKGWRCCKPRVLTFDEFLAIPPCTTGKHSVVDDRPKDPTPATSKSQPEPAAPPVVPIASDKPPQPAVLPVKAIPPSTNATTSPAPPESESDDPAVPIPPNTNCRRRGCDTSSSSSGHVPQEEDGCIYHPGHPIFHEGSKGWTCCKRRVLEFDEFLKIQGCSHKARHLFLGKRGAKDEEKLSTIRHDFYQTPNSVIASFYLKKVDKERARIKFASENSVDMDLPTADNKRYQAQVPLFGLIDQDQSSYKIMGTKVELTLVKPDGSSWATLRSDEQATGEIIQTGRAGRA